MPIDWDQFMETIDGEALKQGAAWWTVRGEKVPLSHKRKDYTENGIEVREFENPDEIGIEEAGPADHFKICGLFRGNR
ncbi:MAG: hypothetical protein WDM78_16740 [Puia sp.]